MEGTQEYDAAEATVARRNSTPEKPYEDDIEEYSYLADVLQDELS